ncbi:alpha-(1,6)-fucosyltransferase 8 [Haematobia irritans]|uniref:alpha-(1,6)-fucosyltransferase 8 n=1 Tax=Haematobia irritans TaxID=7368 RepID=UPI003F4FF1C5
MSFLRQFVGSSSNTWVRALIIFCLAWAILVYIFVTKLNTPNTEEPDSTSKRINQALQLLEESRQRNQELQDIIDTILKDNVDNQAAQKLIKKLENSFHNQMGLDLKPQSPMPYGNPSNEPILEYELLRRRIQTNIAELWNFFSNELGKIKKNIDRGTTSMTDNINSVLILGAEHKRSLLSDMERLRQLDGYEAWRQKESTELSDLVQRRIHHLQNPPECSQAKKLVCKLNKGCGYGCQLHHAVYCFIVAYATERTLILKSKGWRYHKGGWEEVFQPVSDSCLDIGGARANNWPGRPDSQVVVLPIIDSLMSRPPYLPLAIPEDLAPRLKRLHSEPIVWWVGQFLKYLLRPQKGTKAFLETSMEKLGWKKPIVGVHVRRTDKVGTEAAFHSIDEYMTYVEDYYLTQEINGTTMARRIFLASDDARVIDEARKKYPQYEIIGDAEVARMAAVSTRYTDTGLNGIILDIHLLSISDYLVCTFSSQVCRVAYEIMQTLHPDAGHRFKSLDDIYYYGGQNQHNRQVIIPHKARGHDELHLKPGDLVGVAGNHWDGFSKGKNTRTNQVGLFPSFKVVDKVETAKLPTYPNV